jgi:hypothetical protein
VLLWRPQASTAKGSKITATLREAVAHCAREKGSNSPIAEGHFSTLAVLLGKELVPAVTLCWIRAAAEVQPVPV